MNYNNEIKKENILNLMQKKKKKNSKIIEAIVKKLNSKRDKLKYIVPENYNDEMTVSPSIVMSLVDECTENEKVLLFRVIEKINIVGEEDYHQKEAILAKILSKIESKETRKELLGECEEIKDNVRRIMQKDAEFERKSEIQVEKEYANAGINKLKNDDEKAKFILDLIREYGNIEISNATNVGQECYRCCKLIEVVANSMGNKSKIELINQIKGLGSDAIFKTIIISSLQGIEYEKMKMKYVEEITNSDRLQYDANIWYIATKKLEELEKKTGFDKRKTLIESWENTDTLNSSELDSSEINDSASKANYVRAYLRGIIAENLVSNNNIKRLLNSTAKSKRQSFPIAKIMASFNGLDGDEIKLSSLQEMAEKGEEDNVDFGYVIESLTEEPSNESIEKDLEKQLRIAKKQIKYRRELIEKIKRKQERMKKMEKQKENRKI